MFKHLVVPVDGSAVSASVLPMAVEYAAAVGGHVDVVTSIDGSGNRKAPAARISTALAEVPDPAVEIRTHELVAESPGTAIAEFVEGSSGAMVMMSSHGHGRSAAVLGSATDDVLRRCFGPVIVIGPRADRATPRLDGEYVVGVDGSHRSETLLPFVEAWAIEFGGVPWIVEAVPGPRGSDTEVWRSTYPERLAADLRERTGHRVEAEVVYGSRPADAIVGFAAERSAALIFATTHGRTGLRRLRSGSVAADIVRTAHCPVVLSRPPNVEP